MKAVNIRTAPPALRRPAPVLSGAMAQSADLRPHLSESREVSHASEIHAISF